MTPRQSISISIRNRLFSLLLLLMAAMQAQAQGFLKFERDTVPLMRGFTVTGDLVGLGQMLLRDYGQYEAAVQLNLHDQYFPTVEVGYGRANHEVDDVTGLSYKTQAPYFRLGADVNIMKKKHTGNRVFVGVRYGFTSYKIDVALAQIDDPVWKWPTSFDVRGQQCSQHWAEVLFGLSARVLGPLRLGWTARYRIRIKHNDGMLGNTWYVPGFGEQDSSALGATFNVGVDL